MNDRPDISRPIRTLEMRPGHGEMLKPVELIDITGATALTLSARRLYNALLAHAFGVDMANEGQEWSIPLSELRNTHTSNDRIEDSIVALMKTIVTVRLSDGRTRRVALLGGNDMGDRDRQHGTLTYSFDKRLVPILKESSVFGKLELAVMKAFSTKYALALYEAVARRVRLKHIISEEFTLEQFRELLGVPPGKLSSFGNLKEYAIKPALQEVNALATFGVKILPVKDGRKVTRIAIGWWQKDVDGLRAAYAEVHRPRVGRKARASGRVEKIVTAQSSLPL